MSRRGHEKKTERSNFGLEPVRFPLDFCGTAPVPAPNGACLFRFVCFVGPPAALNISGYAGLKYDAVFVDVAYAAVNRTMAAPVEEFFLFETVQQVRNILEDKGMKYSYRYRHVSP